MNQNDHYGALHDESAHDGCLKPSARGAARSRSDEATAGLCATESAHQAPLVALLSIGQVQVSIVSPAAGGRLADMETKAANAPEARSPMSIQARPRRW